MNIQDSTVLFIGAGPMAEAMISGIIQSAIIPSSQIYVNNKNNKVRLKELQSKYHINIFQSNETHLSNFNVIVMAVQPKNIDEILVQLQSTLNSEQLILSVVTSIPTDYYEDKIENQPIIRAMPNTSSMVGESATGMSVGKYATNEHVEIARMLLNSIGEVYVIPEDNMDIFTGIAGSGPAYFYYLMEHMEHAGVEGGLSEQLIRNLVAQTMYGAAKMVLGNIGSPEILCKNVAAPGGPTEAGLMALEAFGGNIAIKEAVINTTKRSAEMNQPFTKFNSASLINK